MRSARWFVVIFTAYLLGVILKSPLMVIFSTALAVVLGVALWWRKYSLSGVEYHRRFHFTRSFPGEKVDCGIEIENRKLLPLSWLRIQDPWPRAVGPEKEDILAPSHIQDRGLLTHVFSLRWYERVRRSYSLLFRKRGVYQVGPATLESGDLFGIYSTEEERGPVETLTVFPELLPLAELDLPADDPFGDLSSRRRLFEDPNRPMGVREYRPEDSFRRVHWPATARTGELQVKIYQPTSAKVMVICLNVSTFTRYWEGVVPALLEHLVRTAATLASQAIARGYRVGLISNGSLSNSDQPFRILPGQSSGQLAHILTALAGVTPITAAPFERFILRETSGVPYGATLLAVTALTSPELCETLINLKRHERRIMLFSLAPEPPPEIPGITCIHRPYQSQELAYAAYQRPD